MFCKNCGVKVKSGSKFCKSCGQEIKVGRFTLLRAQFFEWLKDHRKGLLIFSGIVLFFVIIARYDNSSPIQTTSNNPAVRTTSQNQNEIAASVVNIYCPSTVRGENGSRGSGVIISEEGWIITNSHIIPQDQKRIHVDKSGCLVILPDATTGRPKDKYVAHPFVVREFSDKYDLAYLEIYSAYYDEDKKAYAGVYPRKFPIFDTTNCDKESPKLGDSVRIYGYPEISGGYSLTITDGIVSSFPGGGLIVTSAKVSHGNSGGLAVGKNGCWIGIPSMVSSDERESLGVIISKEVVYKFVKEVDASLKNAGAPASENRAPKTSTKPQQSRVASSPPHSFTDNGDGTITDNISGLIWQQEDDGNKKNWAEANGYCSELTIGQSRWWRLPTIEELKAIVDMRYQPAIDGKYFNNAKAMRYWSATYGYGNNTNAWHVSFNDGYATYSDKASMNYVRCVTLGQPTNAEEQPKKIPTAINVRDVDNGDGTISDAKTWLMWQQEDDGVIRNWGDGQKYCSSLDLGGYSDWRVPTLEELESIIDKSYTPTIDTSYLKNIKSDDYRSSEKKMAYWSSTKKTSNDAFAWGVIFQDGTSGNGSIDNLNYIRCVRAQ